LISTKGGNRFEAGKVTAGMAESNSSLYWWIYGGRQLRDVCLLNQTIIGLTVLSTLFTFSPFKNILNDN